MGILEEDTIKQWAMKEKLRKECKRFDNRNETINHQSKCSKQTENGTRTNMIWWGRWSTRNCAKKWNFSMQANSSCTN